MTPQSPSRVANRHVPWLAGADPSVELTPVLRTSGLSIAFGRAAFRARKRAAVHSAVSGQATAAVSSVSFDVFPSEVLAIVGESGSGKSVTARAVLGLLPDTATVSGSITLLGSEVVGADERTLQPLRGRGAAMVFQEPQTALNPVRTVGWQIGEALRAHARSGARRPEARVDALPRAGILQPVPDVPAEAPRRLDRAAVRRRAIELLELVGISEPERRVDAYPHQLSGGQKQRVVIALALANEPALLIADEPTTALDVTVQADILRLLDSLRQRLGTAILLITHNMGVVADIADRVLVMQSGRLVEQGEVYSVFASPTADYTRALLAAVPTLELDSPVPADSGIDTPSAGAQAGEDERDDLALRMVDVDAHYPGRLGRPPFQALDGVSIAVRRGEVLGIVGESGSGKTTVARVVAGRLPVSAGTVEVAGVDARRLSRADLRSFRGRLGVVYQDPATTLDPLLTVGESIAEPLLIHGGAAGRRASGARVQSLLDSVRLPGAYRHRRPAELSGGQRQRVALARALALEPALLIADEPTSALDVSVQAVVLELLADLQAEHGFACLFISHDLAVVQQISHRVAVMRSGRVVEQGDVDVVLRTPSEEYTQRLLAAAPLADPVAQRARRLAYAEQVLAQRVSR